ncbi:MAG: hypothetical protein AAGH60_06530 [Pseudomonadota bacterium]
MSFRSAIRPLTEPRAAKPWVKAVIVLLLCAACLDLALGGVALIRAIFGLS